MSVWHLCASAEAVVSYGAVSLRLCLGLQFLTRSACLALQSSGGTLGSGPALPEEKGGGGDNPSALPCPAPLPVSCPAGASAPAAPRLEESGGRSPSQGVGAVVGARHVDTGKCNGKRVDFGCGGLGAEQGSAGLQGA